MGATSVSGPVTHPGADHAGAGLERLGQHRALSLARDAAAVAAAASTGTPYGMDVSAYQTSINWSSAWSHGARFAYTKATEGTGYVSPAFGSQYTGSYSAGMIRGAYHFALPDHTSGAAQADYFIGHGGGWSADGRTLPGALDIEYNPYGAECYGLSQAGMRGWIASFVGEYHARTSRWPVIYSTTDWWSTCTGNYGGFASNDPLWIACYCGGAGTLPAGWPAYTIWQNADSGVFPGDQDVFDGNMDGLQRLAAGAGSNPAAVTATAQSVRVYVRGTTRGVYEKSLTASGTWSGFASLGGGFPTNLAALSSSTGTAYVFGVGLNSHLYADTANGTTWSGWRDLGAPSGGVQGVPAAVQDRAGTIRVYVRGGNQNLYEDRLSSTGHWSGLSDLGGILPDDPAAFVGPGGYVWVFGVGANSAVFERYLPPGGGAWSGWASLGGSVTGVPSVVADQGGILRVYLRGINGNLYEDQRLGSRWSGLADLGGILADGPGALVDSTGYVRVFAVGGNLGLFERHMSPAGAWSKWASLGGSVIGVPAAVQDQGGTARVYVRGTNGNLYEDHQPKGGGWSGMSDLGGVLF
jgi:GH25 family lysozyme M1 (1,4-beta-N-acetylmuramidase)